MKSLALIAAAVLFLLCEPAKGQTQTQPSKPGPEYQKLTYFVGDWKTDAEMKPGPYTPGGKFTATDHGEWMDGGFFIVTRSNTTSPFEKGSQLSIMGYDNVQRVYTFESFNSGGVRTAATGTFDGDTWTWTSTDVRGTRTTYVRHTMKILSPTKYSFKFETSANDVDWLTFIEGNVEKTN